MGIERQLVCLSVIPRNMRWPGLTKQRESVMEMEGNSHVDGDRSDYMMTEVGRSSTSRKKERGRETEGEGERHWLPRFCRFPSS